MGVLVAVLMGWTARTARAASGTWSNTAGGSWAVGGNQNAHYSGTVTLGAYAALLQ